MIRTGGIKVSGLELEEVETRRKVKSKITRKCRWCGHEFEVNFPNQRYCCDHCQDEGSLDRNRKRQQKFYETYGKDFYKKRPLQPGGVGLGPHPNLDPDLEYQSIKSEFKRLKLKSVVKYSCLGFGVMSLMMRVVYLILSG